MANVYFQTVTSFICAGQYAAIVNYWAIDDSELSGNPFVDAEFVIAQLTGSNVGPGDNWQQLLVSLLSADSFVSSIRCRQVSGGPSGPTAQTVFGAGDYSGGWGGNLDAFQTSANVNWIPNTQNAVRGWSHMPGVAAEALVNNRFVEDYTDALASVVAQVVYGFGITTAKVFMHVRHGAAPSYMYSPVIGGYLSPTPGHVKKRRLPV